VTGQDDRRITGDTGTQKLVGYVIDLTDGKVARCWLDVGPMHLNRHHVLHGGIASMLLDTASGFAASLSVDAGARVPFLTVSLSVGYLAPGRPGLVTAQGRVTGGGRRLVHVAADLRHADGTLIATSTGVFTRVRPGRAAGATPDPDGQA
jgi:uncharacterized protein (TIGR00369 family)